MSKSRHHTPPSESDRHKQLHQLVAQNNFDTHKSRRLLWFLNAHENLPFFHQILFNLNQVFRQLSKQKIPLDLYGFAGLPELVSWLVSQRQALEKIHPDLVMKAEGHISKAPGLTRNGLYFLFRNTAEIPSLRPLFNSLLGYLFCVHAKALQDYCSLNEYESYSGGEEILASFRPVYPATLAMRKLSRVEYSSCLESFEPVFRAKSPREYLENHFSIPDSCTLTKYIRDLVRYLLKAREQKSSRAPRSKPGGSEVDPGYVGYSYGEFSEVTDVDRDDPFSVQNEKTFFHEFVAHSELSPDDRQALAAGVCAEELMDDSELTLIQSDCKTARRSIVGEIRALRSQKAYMAMDNQHFAWASRILTRAEAKMLMDAIDQECRGIRQALKKEKRDLKSKTRLRLESLLLLKVCFWFGKKLESAVKLRLVGPDQDEDDLEIALCRSRTGYVWRIKAFSPFEDILDSHIPGYFWSRYLYIKDLTRLAKEIENATGSALSKGKPAFKRQLDVYRKDIKSYLERFRDFKPTLKKVEDFMFDDLARFGGDICMAATFTGRFHHNVRSRAFYFSPTVESVLNEYLERVRVIAPASILKSYGRKSRKELLNTLIKSAKQFYPKWPVILCRHELPPLQEVKTLFECIVSALRTNSKADNTRTLIEVHNAYTLYTLLFFSFITGMRAISSPFRMLDEHHYVPEFELVVIADKDTEYRNKTRYAYIPPGLRQQIEHYLSYLDEISSNPALVSKPVKEKIDRARGFFLDDEGRVFEIKPGKTASIFRSLNFPYPPNIHRRFMKTWLASEGCPEEITDAWMGHWSYGQEPFGPYSVMSFEDYKRSVGGYLEKMSGLLHLEPIKATWGAGNVWGSL